MSLPAQPNRSLIDGLTILQEISARNAPAGSRELARDLDIEPTRVNRLLKTLSHLGLAKQNLQRKYEVGPGIHVLAAQALFGSGILRSAIPHLQALHSHNLIVAMGVLWRDKVSYLYHAEPEMDNATALGRVGLFPAKKSAIGLALLARNNNLRRCDSELKQLIEQTRKQGFASVLQSGRNHIDDQLEQRSTGSVSKTNKACFCSLGVAVPGDSATAIALSGNIKTKDKPKLIKALKQAAENIAQC